MSVTGAGVSCFRVSPSGTRCREPACPDPCGDTAPLLLGRCRGGQTHHRLTLPFDLGLSKEPRRRPPCRAEGSVGPWACGRVSRAACACGGGISKILLEPPWGHLSWPSLGRNILTFLMSQFAVVSFQEIVVLIGCHEVVLKSFPFGSAMMVPLLILSVVTCVTLFSLGQCNSSFSH